MLVKFTKGQANVTMVKQRVKSSNHGTVKLFFSFVAQLCFTFSLPLEILFKENVH